MLRRTTPPLCPHISMPVRIMTALQAASVFPPDGVPSVDAFSRLFPTFKNILVLSGAGISTAAGIPVRALSAISISSVYAISSFCFHLACSERVHAGLQDTWYRPIRHAEQIQPTAARMLVRHRVRAQRAPALLLLLTRAGISRTTPSRCAISIAPTASACCR